MKKKGRVIAVLSGIGGLIGSLYFFGDSIIPIIGAIILIIIGGAGMFFGG